MKKVILAASVCVALAFGYAASGSAADGKELFSKCAGCHGADASKGIKSKAEADVMKALKGYKDKTYGGDKKAIMEGLTAKLSDEDIAALSQYISKL